jgi:uncharacterized membrane protein (DUF106 family)
MIIIVILVVAIFVGLMLSGIIAPVLIFQNRKRLAEMKELIKQYEGIEEGGRSVVRMRYTQKLLEVKGKIFKGDKAAVVDAADLMEQFYQISY